jgi:hypothetical protein
MWPNVNNRPTAAPIARQTPDRPVNLPEDAPADTGPLGPAARGFSGETDGDQEPQLQR